MPDCNYCGESFDDEQSHLEHLAAAHEGELGAIDRRRVGENVTVEESGLPTGPLVLGGVLLVAALVVAYVLFFVGSGSGGTEAVNGIEVAQTPGPLSQSGHGHGLMNVTIDGQQLDFSQPRFQTQADPFHFEGGNGRVWHKHADGVTLEYAMATLGIGLEEDAVTYDGTTYSDGDPGTDVTVTVSGEPVDPAAYELQGASDQSPEDGDFIRIVVETDGGS